MDDSEHLTDDGSVDLTSFADEDGNIQWAEVLSIGFATVFLGWVTGLIEFIWTIGTGLDTALDGLGSWLYSGVSTVVGIPEGIVTGGLGEITTWTPDTDWLPESVDIGSVTVSQEAMGWLDMFGPLALPISLIWWGAVAVVMVWGLSKIYDAWRGGP